MYARLQARTYGTNMYVFMHMPKYVSKYDLIKGFYEQGNETSSHIKTKSLVIVNIRFLWNTLPYGYSWLLILLSNNLETARKFCENIIALLLTSQSIFLSSGYPWVKSSWDVRLITYSI